MDQNSAFDLKFVLGQKKLYPSHIISNRVFSVPLENTLQVQVKVYLVATCSFEVSLYSLLTGIFDISTFFFGETKTNRQAKNISKHCKQYPPENDHISHNQAGTFAWICVDDDFPAFPLGEICHILPCRMVSITYPPPRGSGFPQTTGLLDVACYGRRIHGGVPTVVKARR